MWGLPDGQFLRRGIRLQGDTRAKVHHLNKPSAAAALTLASAVTLRASAGHTSLPLPLLLLLTEALLPRRLLLRPALRLGLQALLLKLFVLNSLELGVDLALFFALPIDDLLSPAPPRFLLKLLGVIPALPLIGPLFQSFLQETEGLVQAVVTHVLFRPVLLNIAAVVKGCPEVVLVLHPNQILFDASDSAAQRARHLIQLVVRADGPGLRQTGLAPHPSHGALRRLLDERPGERATVHSEGPHVPGCLPWRVLPSGSRAGAGR
mmetsp:Transcript_26079/g.58921  ORF Transcript_26079/g.58921 Transcript_26079/m.58921 type:complete len:264 (-) Transcript_26079:256-1047(-)